MVIFFKALCARIDADRLFERDFVLETGEVALRHGKYDRQYFEKVVSATGCEPVEGLVHRPCLQLLPQEHRSGEGRQEHDQVERPVRLHRPHRGRGRAADIRHHQLARGAPDDGGASSRTTSSTARTSRRSRSAGRTSSSSRLRRGSIGSRRSLPGASSARSSTSSSTRSSRFWSRTRGVASRPRTSSSIRARPTSSSPTRTSSAGTATETRTRSSTA